MTKEIILKKVNGQSIQIIEENGQKFVPIKPICEALGVAFEPQYRKVKEDEILNSTVTFKVTVGLDGKQREMICLPLKFVFGWLFTINPKNVNENSRPTVIRYKIECYNILYDYFTRYAEFVSYKNEKIEKAIEDYQHIQIEFRTAKERMTEAKNHLNKVRKLTITDWENENSQLKLELN